MDHGRIHKEIAKSLKELRSNPTKIWDMGWGAGDVFCKAFGLKKKQARALQIIG